MATWESEKRMERRRTQRYWERVNADPEIIALRRYIAARQRYHQRHPFSGHQPGLAGLLRCRKRLGSRFCWNWRLPGADRCYRHARRQQ